MKLVLKNRFYRFVTLSRFLNALGSAMHNLVFFVLSASMYPSSPAVNLDNITVAIPTVFTVFVGMWSDGTRRKTTWLIVSGFSQVVLFSAIALAVGHKTWFVFSIVCLFNIMSDVLSDYKGGLMLPMTKFNVDEEDLTEAFSFTTVIRYICDYRGQVMVVWILAVSGNDFSIVAMINAFSFMAATLVLFFVRGQLVYEPVESPGRTG
ncbi:MAG: hypothetical protein ACFN3E_06035 [Parascardovia denticolens]